VIEHALPRIDETSHGVVVTNPSATEKMRVYSVRADWILEPGEWGRFVVGEAYQPLLRGTVRTWNMDATGTDDRAVFLKRLQAKVRALSPTPEEQERKRKKELTEQWVREGGCCHCGEYMRQHPNPFDCGHSPVEMREDEPELGADQPWNEL
jgi:hypothetical protein